MRDKCALWVPGRSLHRNAQRGQKQTCLQDGEIEEEREKKKKELKSCSSFKTLRPLLLSVLTRKETIGDLGGDLLPPSREKVCQIILEDKLFPPLKRGSSGGKGFRSKTPMFSLLKLGALCPLFYWRSVVDDIRRDEKKGFLYRS